VNIRGVYVFTGSSLQYIIVETERAEKTELVLNFYILVSLPTKLSNSFLIASPVLSPPNLAATVSQDSRSNNLYLIILCILAGIRFMYLSTILLVSPVVLALSASISSSCLSLESSSDE